MAGYSAFKIIPYMFDHQLVCNRGPLVDLDCQFVGLLQRAQLSQALINEYLFLSRFSKSASTLCTEQQYILYRQWVLAEIFSSKYILLYHPSNGNTFVMEDLMRVAGLLYLESWREVTPTSVGTTSLLNDLQQRLQKCQPCENTYRLLIWAAFM
jgi:hypothetical protein